MKKKPHTRDEGADLWIILKWILKQQCERFLAGIICLRICLMPEFCKPFGAIRQSQFGQLGNNELFEKKKRTTRRYIWFYSNKFY